MRQPGFRYSIPVNRSCSRARAAEAHRSVRQGFQTLGVDRLPAAFAESINTLFDATHRRFDLCEESFEVIFERKILADLFDFGTVIANVIARSGTLLCEARVTGNFCLDALHFRKQVLEDHLQVLCHRCGGGLNLLDVGGCLRDLLYRPLGPP